MRETQGVKHSPKQQAVQRRNAEAAQKAAQAAQMRASKATYEQIARTLKYKNRGIAYRVVQRELNRVVVENIDELRREELVALDILQRECMAIFLDKNAKGRLFAVDRILSVMERRARLMGLDQQQDPSMRGIEIIIQEVPAQYFGQEEPPQIVEAS